MSFQPRDIFYIQDVETLKVLADARRIQILEITGEGEKTAKEIANQMQMATSKLYYHLKMMEEHDIITVVEERVGPTQIIEKVYQATAHRYMIAEDLQPLEHTEASLNLAFQAIDKVKLELQYNAEALLQPDIDETRAEFGMGKLHLTREEAAELAQELQAIWDRFRFDKVRPNTDVYTLLLAFFPTPKQLILNQDDEDDDEHPN